MPAPPRLVVRPATDRDYPALAALWTEIHPGDALSADALRHIDAQHVPPARLERWVAEHAGRVVGSAVSKHSLGSFDPERYLITVQVTAAARGQGIGAALYRRLREALEPHAPRSLRGQVRGDDPRALRFAADRGFVETKRDTPWSLDLTRFDPAPHAAARTALERAGVRLASLADLDAAGTDWRRPFWALFSQVRRDVPRAEPVRDIPFERFAQMSYAAPDFAPELALVALATEVSEAPDAMIGMSQLWRDAEAGADEAFTGLTGVVRSWRRRGVALALKVAALERAAAAGVRRVHTDNDERNAGMLAINRRLGFEAGAPILSMRLEPVSPLEPG